MSNMVVRTNVMSLNSHRNLGMTGNQQARASQRLSSGFRINSAADDAAGLAISEKMRGQIRGLDQASRNGQDGISLIQTAEGAMSTVNDMVIRVRELVLQSANDTNAHDSTNLPQSDRQQIQREINQLLEEIDDVTLRTEFNTRTLLDGSAGLSLTLGSFAVPGTFATAVAGAIAGIDAAHIDANGQWGTGVTEEQKNQMLAALEGVNSVLSAAMELRSTLLSAGVTPEAAHFSALATNATDIQNNAMVGVPGANPGAITGANLLAVANAAAAAAALGEGSLWFQIGANEGQGVNLSIRAVNVDALNTAGGHNGGFNVSSLRNNSLISGQGIMLANGEDINRFVSALDGALAHVTGQRAHLGAMQNRLEFTIENLDVASENLSAANSRIRDADMAREMMAFTQSNVLQQAAISMLAQANQAPQNILQLLR